MEEKRQSASRKRIHRNSVKLLEIMNKNNKIAASLLLALLASGLAGAEELSESELKDLETARSALEKGNNPQALEILNPLYEKHPQHDEISNNYAVALFNNGQAAEAGIVLQGYLESHNQVGTASNNLFRVYDFLAAESYSMLSGSEPERPKLAIASSANPAITPSNILEEAPVRLRDHAQDLDTETLKIERRMQGYLAAWSAGNAEAYLSYYYPDRSPVRGQGFERWKEERQRKIFPERNISVSMSDLQIMPIDNSQAIAVYRQSYSASNYRDETTKQLTWLKQGGEWYIRYEAALPN